MNWQPIETAPKSYSLILLCEVRHHIDEYESSITTGFWGEKHAGHFANDVMQWCDWNAGMDEDDVWAAATPTHWMPLPPPPSFGS